MGSPYLQPAIGSAPAYQQLPAGNAMDPLALQDPALSAETMDWQNAEMYDQNGNLIPMAPGTAGYRVENEEPIKEEKPGFFDKIGAAVKGVLDAPGKILSGLADPKNLALLVGGVVVSVLFPPAAPFIALAGVGMAGMGVVQGASAMASGWQNDDLDAIREGSSIASANGLGLALGVKGFKTSTIRNLRAAGIKRVKVKDMRGRVRNIRVDDISTWQAMRLQGKAFKGSMGQFKKDYAKTKGSMPQRLVAVARKNMAGAPSGHRPRRRMSNPQRRVAVARTAVEAIRLSRSIQQAWRGNLTVTPRGGTGPVTQSLGQHLTDAWGSGGRAGLGNVANLLLRDRTIHQVTDPLLQRSLQFGAGSLERFGNAGRLSTGLRIASEGVGARGQVHGLVDSVRGLRTNIWTPLTATGGGSLFNRIGSINRGDALDSALGVYDNGTRLLNQGTLMRDVIMRRPGVAEKLAKNQEWANTITDIRAFYNQNRSFRNPVTREAVTVTPGAGRPQFNQYTGEAVAAGETINPVTGAAAANPRNTRFSPDGTDVTGVSGRTRYAPDGTDVSTIAGHTRSTRYVPGTHTPEAAGTARGTVYNPVTGAPAARGDLFNPTTGAPLPAGTSANAFVDAAGTVINPRAGVPLPAGARQVVTAQSAQRAQAPLRPVQPVGPQRFVDIRGIATAGPRQQFRQMTDMANLYFRGRDAFMDMTGRTANVGNTIPNPGGPARFGRIGQQSSKAFDFVQAHPGAVQGSVPLPLATGIQSDLQKKYMEMAQMQQLALSGMQAQA